MNAWCRTASQFLLAGLASTLLAGCTGPNRLPQELSGLGIKGLTFENRSRIHINAIQLQVPLSGNFVSCGNIAPGAICSTAFPEQRFTGNPVEVTWSQAGAIHTTRSIQLRPGPEVLEAGQATVSVVIVAPGSAGVELLPVKETP